MSQTTDWTAPSYSDADGVHHTVVCDFHDAGAWRVLDVTSTEVLLVERLGGYDDGEAQARPLAEDYAQQMRNYHNGELERHPLPHPVQLRFTAGREPAAVRAARPKPAHAKHQRPSHPAQAQLPIAA